MSPYSYQALAFLPSSIDISIMSILAQRLSKSFGEVDLSQDHKKISVILHNPVEYEETWNFRLYYENEPHVIIESAEFFTRHPETAAFIATCDRRITYGCDPDPNMDYFNDFMIVAQRLHEIEGAIVYDPNTGIFFGES